MPIYGLVLPFIGNRLDTVSVQNTIHGLQPLRPTAHCYYDPFVLQ